MSQNGRRTLQTVCASCHVVITGPPGAARQTPAIVRTVSGSPALGTLTGPGRAALRAVLELDEETMSDSLPLVMLRYVVKALDVDVRGCLSKRDLAHCVSKTRLEDTVGRFRAQVRSRTPGVSGARGLGH